MCNRFRCRGLWNVCINYNTECYIGLLDIFTHFHGHSSLNCSLSHSYPFYSACMNRSISLAGQISETGVTRCHPRFVCSNSSISLHPQRKAELRMLYNVVNYIKTRVLQFLKRINLCQKVRVLLYVVVWNPVARVFCLVAMVLLCYSSC